MTQHKQLFGKIAILGVGLIGGSLGMALKHCKAAASIAGFDIDTESLEIARETGAIDYGATDIHTAVKDAEIVVLSTPVNFFAPLVKDFAGFLKPGAIITDTGSTKSQILTELFPLIPDAVEFVGGHPMTGSEKGGIKAADRYLFENAVYVVTPTEKNSPSAVAKVKALAEAVGSRVIVMDPEEHDTIVAAVSHVPHLTAAGLTATLMQVSQEYPFAPTLAAGGFRDTTRIAAGDPDLWQQICLSNDEKIVQTLDLLCSMLETAKKLIMEGNREGLHAFFAEAREQRLKIPSGLRGILPAIYEVVVTVPDQPGVIGSISALLGDNDVNIIDIEILRVREGDGGTIRLGFQSEYEREKAEKVFRENNVPVKRL